MSPSFCARKHLEEFQVQRSNCLGLQGGIRDRKLRVSVAKLLTHDLVAFRLFLDHLSCAAADVCGEGVFSNLNGVGSVVDMFFGAVMRLEVCGARVDPTAVRVCITRLRRAARKFIGAARQLPHDGTINSRLRVCEQQFEKTCDDALWNLRVP